MKGNKIRGNEIRGSKIRGSKFIGGHIKKEEEKINKIVRCYFLLPLLFCILLVFSGCASLAKEERVAGNDQLIGIFLRVETEGESLQESFGEKVDDRSPQNPERLLEKKVENSWDDRIFGRIDEETKEFVFEGMEGYSLGKYREEGDEIDNWEIPEGGSSGVGTYYSEGLNVSELIADVELKSDWNREEIQWNLSGTMFFEKTDEEYALSCYLVYQTEEGEIYAIRDAGMIFSTESPKRGGSMQITDTITEKGIGGNRIEERFSVKVSFDGWVSPVVASTFAFYDESGNPLKKEICEGAAVPMRLVRPVGTAFVFVSQELKDGSRSFDLIKPEDREYRFCIEGDGMLLRQKVIAIEDGSVYWESVKSNYQ